MIDIAWDLAWIILRLVLILAFLAGGFIWAADIWRHGRAAAVICPQCGVTTPLSRAKAHQHCRNCSTALVENHVPLPGIAPIKVGAGGR